MSGNNEQSVNDSGTITDDVGGNNGGAIGGDAGTVEQPVKRGRGRPPKSASPVDGERINPADFGSGSNSADDAGGPAPARRGRKPGSAAKSKAVPLDVNALAMMLAAAQMTAVKFTGLPECELDANQNAALSQALANVARHYPIAVSQKHADLMALIVVSGNIAFAQFGAYRHRVAAETKPRMSVV